MDITKAKEYLKSGYSVAILGEKEFLSKERGIAYIAGLAELKYDLKGYVAADKIVGKAAAYLYVLLRVKEIYAEVISVEAERILLSSGIVVSYGIKTNKIINRKGDGLCPMEVAVQDARAPTEALCAILKTLVKLRENKFNL